MKKKREADRENKLGCRVLQHISAFFIFLPFNGSQAISSTSIILFVTTSKMRKVLWKCNSLRKLKENNALKIKTFKDSKRKKVSAYLIHLNHTFCDHVKNEKMEVQFCQKALKNNALKTYIFEDGERKAYKHLSCEGSVHQGV